jgi:hypothetical protein
VAASPGLSVKARRRPGHRVSLGVTPNLVSFRFNPRDRHNDSSRGHSLSDRHVTGACQSRWLPDGQPASETDQFATVTSILS